MGVSRRVIVIALLSPTPAIRATGDLYRSDAVDLRDFVVTRRLAKAITKVEKRRLSEDESIESIVRRVRSLERDDVAEVGQLPAGIHTRWRNLRSTQVVVTGPQWQHILDRHPEMGDLLPDLIVTLQDPHEIYTNGQAEPNSATLWRAIDANGDRWIRVTVSLATPEKGSGIDNSVITARTSRRRGYLRDVRAETKVWPKGEA